jgi:hypothetical protein
MHWREEANGTEYDILDAEITANGSSPLFEAILNRLEIQKLM